MTFLERYRKRQAQPKAKAWLDARENCRGTLNGALLGAGSLRASAWRAAAAMIRGMP